MFVILKPHRMHNAWGGQIRNRVHGHISYIKWFWNTKQRKAVAALKNKQKMKLYYTVLKITQYKKFKPSDH